MFRGVSVLITAAAIIGCGHVYAQETSAGPGVVEVSIIPGGGVKWYARNTRRGLRGDYRFLMTKSNNNAPSFFGQDNRYGHRHYAGVIVNAAR